MISIDDLLTEMVERHASDCFVKAGFEKKGIHTAGLTVSMAEVISQTIHNLTTIFPFTALLLLLTVWRLQHDAYGLSIRRAVSDLLGKKVSVGAVYIPLERLARKGFLESWESQPTARRGGRRKRFYKLTSSGLAALNTVKQLHDAAWSGLPDLVFG